MIDPALAISVVIPTRDTMELTLRAVASVRASSLAAREVVVVDDGGTDGTAADLAELDPAVLVLRNPRSLGFTRAANRGAAATTGELLLLLNSDTEVAPEALEEIALAFATDPRLGVAGATLHYPDGSPQWSAGPTPSLAWFFALASGAGAALHRLPGYTRARAAGPATRPAPVAWVSGAAMAIRRATWDAVGPFDERFFFYAQDLDLCRRAHAAGWSVALLPRARVLHHHGASIARGPSAALRHDPGLLWRDLVAWADKTRGPRYAARVTATLRAGARLRLAGRALAAPLLPAARRNALAEDSRGFRRALDERGPGLGAATEHDEPLD